MSEPSPGDYPKLAGCGILVVEDEALIVAVIEEMLIDLGCGTVWTAATTDQASTILRDHRPHAAILDVNLGGESGYRLAQVLADSQIPFVFATGYGRRGLAEQWATRPVIQKPFKLDTLAAVLSALL
ncbi:MAG TPA: response regulator [Stellaceae bacterium]|nr:response regulator [Stellaceae bacterium]